MVQKVFGIREARNGTKNDELLQAGASGHKRAWQDVETNSGSRGRQNSCKGGKNGKMKDKKENHEKRLTEAFG